MTNLQPTVLYVEDDPSSREVMILILREMMGCDLIIFLKTVKTF